LLFRRFFFLSHGVELARGSRPVCETARGYACARANSLLEYFMNEFSFNPQVGATTGFLSRNALIAVLGAVALLGSCILLISTRWGLAVTRTQWYTSGLLGAF